MTAAVTTLNELSAAWGPLLWQASWQGGVALLLVLFLNRSLRRIPAPVQCWLWRLAFFKLLIAGLWIAPVELHWLAPGNSTVSSSLTGELPLPIDRPAMTSMTAHSAGISSVAPAEGDGPHLSRLSWMFLAWVVGVSLSLANLVGRWTQIRRMVSRLPNITDERIQKILADHCRQMGIRRPPELCVSNNSGGPFLVGIVRPLIVLPSIVLESCSEDERHAALNHELAHVRRRDLLWNWLPALAEVVFFFHPLLWLARREWRLSQEIAADELAVTVSRMNVARYAQSLLELVAHGRAVTTSPHLAISMSQTYSQLRRRMIAMQTFQPLTTYRRFTMAALALALGVLGVVPWKLAAQESPAAPVADAAETIAQALAQTDAPTDAQNEVAEPSRNVRGIVVDEDLRPVPGAIVIAGRFHKESQQQTLTTDANGRFETKFSYRERPLVVAYKEGMTLASHWKLGEPDPNGKHEEPEARNVFLVLNRPVPFVGRVQDPQGNPIPEADVRVEIFTTREPSDKDWNHLLAIVLDGSKLDQYLTTTTNAQGEFRFSAFPEGARAMLRISAEGRGLLRTMAYFSKPDRQFYRGTDDDPAVLTLEKEGIVEGRVTTDLAGVSVAGLTVHIQASKSTPVAADPYSVETDADGRFHFDGLAQGTANVFLVNHEPDGPWTYRAAADVPIHPGKQSQAVIELIKNFIVEGQVIDEAGDPVADARVGVYGPIRPRSGAAIIGYRTKEDGKYRFHLPPGSTYFYISGHPPGYKRGTSGILDVPAGEGTLVGPTLVVQRQPLADTTDAARR